MRNRIPITEQILRRALTEQLWAEPTTDSITNQYQGVELMSLPTDEIFVSEAYRRILGRKPDIDGLHHFTKVLQTHSRQTVLDALTACVPQSSGPESADPGAPALVDLTVLGNIESPEQFVRECYSKIMGREADAAGLRHYRLLLTLGVPRVQVIGILAMSDEARARNQTLLWHGSALPLEPLSWKHRLLIRFWNATGISSLEDGIFSLRAATAGTQGRLDGLREELKRIATSLAAVERQSASTAERELQVLAAADRWVETEHETAQQFARLKEEIALMQEAISHQDRHLAEQLTVLTELRKSGGDLIGKIETIASDIRIGQESQQRSVTQILAGTAEAAQSAEAGLAAIADDIRIRQEAMEEAQQRNATQILAGTVEAAQRAEAGLAAIADDIRIRQEAMEEAQQRNATQILAGTAEAARRAEANLAAVANDIRIRQEAMAEAQQQGVTQILAGTVAAEQHAETNLAAVANDIRVRQEAMEDAQQRFGGEVTLQLSGIRDRADQLLSSIRPPVLQTDELYILRVSNLLLGVPREDLCLAALYAQWGAVDLGMSRWITSNLRPGLIFVDIGANVGLHTLEAARAVGPSGKVYAFEPAPRTLAALRANLKLNGIKQVEVFPVAVMDRPGPVKLHINREDGSLNSIFPGEEAREAIEVQGLPLDAALAGRDRVDVVKIDAEGAEFLILHGMTNVLKRNPEIVLLVEFAPEHLARAGVKAPEYLAYLRSLGFRIRRVDELTGDVLPVKDQELLDTASTNLCLDRA